MQVSPSEIENYLLSHPSIADAGVVGLPDKECDNLPSALIVLKPGAKMSAEQVREYVAGKYLSMDNLSDHTSQIRGM